MRVRYVAPFAIPSGYGRAAADYLMALKGAGVALEIVPMMDADSEDLEPRYAELFPLVGLGFDPTHVIVHTVATLAHEFVTGDLAPHPDVKKICVTTWETDKLPKATAARLAECFDLVIVPSTFCSEVLTRAGIPRVRVVPHGFDPKFWCIDPPPVSSDPRFIFYSIGAWAERKNPIGLLKAYLSEFTSKDQVLLRIVTPFVNEDDVTTLSRCMGLDDLPAVEFWTQRLTEVELRSLHYLSDGYVSLSRGEAWGLGAFEAASVGNLIIATGFSGWRDFLNDYPNKRYVEYQLTPAVTPETTIQKPITIGGLTITPVAANAPSGIAGDQNWAEPDLHHAKFCLREAYTSPRKKRRNAQHFDRLYGYEAVGEKFKKLLEAL